MPQMGPNQWLIISNIILTLIIIPTVSSSPWSNNTLNAPNKTSTQTNWNW